jgi:hypothetical protein
MLCITLYQMTIDKIVAFFIARGASRHLFCLRLLRATTLLFLHHFSPLRLLRATTLLFLPHFSPLRLLRATTLLFRQPVTLCTHFLTCWRAVAIREAVSRRPPATAVRVAECQILLFPLPIVIPPPATSSPYEEAAVTMSHRGLTAAALCVACCRSPCSCCCECGPQVRRSVWPRRT